MTAQQLIHYKSLPSQEARAAYLVTIHEAPDFPTACSQMAARRKAFARDQKAYERDRKDLADEALRQRAIAANPYADLD